MTVRRDRYHDLVDEKGRQTCTEQPRVVRFNLTGVPSQQVKVLFLKGHTDQ